ncbi:MAG: DinB family protein [Calditrichaeota bacterium]|nr:MAG: DinB family protein [Calditrichota bacterium]
MYTTETLQDLHTRGHNTLQKLLEHCDKFNSEELNREFEGFGYPNILQQFHHTIGAEEYWIGVVEGLMKVDDNASDFTTIESLKNYREQVFTTTENYLKNASTEELNTERKMITWGNNERNLIPARVFLRTFTHIYQHQGQIVTLCRLLGRPISGTDFPIL